MKHLIALMLCCAMCGTAMANHPDSVFVRPDIEPGAHSMYIAYSLDNKHWKHIDQRLLDGDYGPWGRQKKIYYPVLTYDGKIFHATFIPDPKCCQIATTESKDFRLWKPQDYPFIPKTEFNNLLEKQKKASAENVIKVPYSTINGFLHYAKRKKLDTQWEAENYIATAKPIADKADSITLKMTVNLNDTKAISPNLIGAFFEDISYAADGGLYAELIQNRDFEYTPADHKGWDALTSWTLQGSGTTLTIKDKDGISQNNPHYAVLTTTAPGAKFINSGWDGIVLKKGAKYNLSMFLKTENGKWKTENGKSAIRVSLVADSKILASTTFKATAGWKQQHVVLTPTADADSAQLVIEPLQQGELAIDFVSLFPKDTFKGRENGLRKDLAEAIADLHPRFIRFPGGCASHGNGIDNIYHWKSSIGNLWDRKPDFNIWHYHQTRGLGFYEYFQFCEDIGAEPLPVLAAGVPCQNSSVGGNGQQGGIPFSSQLSAPSSQLSAPSSQLTMESYLQELLDLIEWANGDAKTSKLAQMRAKAGHPKPFNLKYLGIGNEDLISDVFMERYLYLINGVRKAHPEITIVGTVGPFWEGSDYEYGWKAAKKYDIPIVDEHYYNTPGWYFHHRDFYDNYDRNGTKVYLGEWASHGVNTSNALIEAAYLTNVERNADVVKMSSYAPLLAKKKHTNWNPSMIYFDNSSVSPTANYYVQRLFGQNSGDTYVYSNSKIQVSSAKSDSKLSALSSQLENRIDRSVVIDSTTGDIIIKLVSLLPKSVSTTIDIPGLTLGKKSTVTITTLSQPTTPDKEKQWSVNETYKMENGKWKMENSQSTALLTLNIPAWSVTTIRIHK